jgi:transposase InsO family protein
MKFGRAFIDTGCLTYGLISDRFARNARVTRINLPHPVQLEGVNGKAGKITQIAKFAIDIDGHKRDFTSYVVRDLLGYDIFLGLPFLEEQNVEIRTKSKCLYFRDLDLIVRTEQGRKKTSPHQYVSAATFVAAVRRNRRQGIQDDIECFTASLKDIEKALRIKPKIVVRDHLPELYWPFAHLFEPDEAKKLPPYRGRGIDMPIEFQKENGQDPPLPYGPLYEMSRDELLVLRKTLTELLDQGFIRLSHSPMAAPVLFVRKPGGGLRFCCDYRALNSITRKDRTPLPLIQETLNQLSRAQWFTTLDVSAAFHKLRIKKGDEWKTAFRTRYGLFEWLVVPFGVTNGPSTFQKYINSVLQDYLDDFVTAYIDDILIFTSGSLSQHQEHVRKVLHRLEEAGLHLDLSKCKFEQRRTKYLGYIIDSDKGIYMDPEKIKAIKEWQIPTTARAVRSFLGFANFYRKFITHFSTLTAPLQRLTKQGVTFEFGPDEKKAFNELKRLFSSDPILAPFDPERYTVIEADASKWASGATLSQEDELGTVRPVAYFSKRHTAAETNYPIHDKEMLAIIRALEAWEGPLRSVRKFTVISDHRNLQWFQKSQRLSERQIRWAGYLSKFNLEIRFRPGRQNSRADALSRREQDIPYGETDERLAAKEFQVLVPAQSNQTKNMRVNQETVRAFPSLIQPNLEKESLISPEIPGEAPLQQLIQTRWETAKTIDRDYQIVLRTIQKGDRALPPAARRIAVSLGDCSLQGGELLFRNRKWVPDDEPIRTAIIQTAHASIQTGHPGREETYRILSQQWYWPGAARDVRRFIKNCDLCRANKPWREKKFGLLRPLPVPLRTWQELSMDFVGPLPASEGRTMLLVITDRLSKAVILVPMKETTAVHAAWALLTHVYAHHGLPRAIVSDRGTQFVNDLWKEVCRLLQVERRLSTAYHPQTDGATERMNEIVETVFRTYINQDQTDWAPLCPIFQYAINTRTASTIGTSPFFLNHGFQPTPFPKIEEELARGDEFDKTLSMKDRGQIIVRKLQDATNLAIATMTYTQQQQEAQANRSRQAAPKYKTGDQVWVDLRNVRTAKQSKKLDQRHAKYTITSCTDPYFVTVDIPGYPKRFHVDQIRPAAIDPFPSQKTNDPRPPPVLVQNDEGEPEHLEYIPGEILDEWIEKGETKLLVRWTGWPDPTREPLQNLEDTAVYQAWLDKTQTVRLKNGRLKRNWRKTIYSETPTTTTQEDAYTRTQIAAQTIPRVSQRNQEKTVLRTEKRRVFQPETQRRRT